VEPVIAPIIGHIDHDEHTNTDSHCQSPDIENAIQFIVGQVSQCDLKIIA
jgi:hypothetical protein